MATEQPGIIIDPALNERHGDFIHLFIGEEEYSDKRENDYKEPWLSYTEDKTITVRSDGSDTSGYTYFGEVKATIIDSQEQGTIKGYAWLRPSGGAPAFDAFTDSDSPEIGDLVYSLTYNTGSGRWEVYYMTTDDTVSELVDNGVVHYNKTKTEVLESTYLTFDIESDGQINWLLTVSAGDGVPKTIEYRKNGGEWTEITSTTGGTKVNVVSGDTVEFRGDNAQYACSSQTAFYRSYFRETTCQYSIKGNIMSLLDEENFESKKTLDSAWTFFMLFAQSNVRDASNLVLPATAITEHCYRNLFQGCSALTHGLKVLPAKTLTTYCYSAMYIRCPALLETTKIKAETMANNCCTSMYVACTSLTEVCDLPAINLAESCYYQMFSGCTNLVKVKRLPATTLAPNCYYSMFRACTSLVGVPRNLLPAEIVPEGAYRQMFYECLSLERPPYMPATTYGTQACNMMFFGCTSLINAPELPATTLGVASYFYMFKGCTNLKRAPSIIPAMTIPASACAMMFRECLSLETSTSLPATGVGDASYLGMFLSCATLTSVPQILPAATLAASCYTAMFQGCSAITSVPELPALNLAINCYHQMFLGCISLTGVPYNFLPATTLADNCYFNMLRECTNLIQAPELQAATLAKECYAGMFTDCHNLNYIKCLATNISASNCTGAWLANVASSGTFVKAASMTSWPTGNSGIPAGWTVQDAS